MVGADNTLGSYFGSIVSRLFRKCLLTSPGLSYAVKALGSLGQRVKKSSCSAASHTGPHSVVFFGNHGLAPPSHGPLGTTFMLVFAIIKGIPKIWIKPYLHEMIKGIRHDFFKVFRIHSIHSLWNTQIKILVFITLYSFLFFIGLPTDRIRRVLDVFLGVCFGNGGVGSRASKNIKLEWSYHDNAHFYRPEGSAY